MSEPSSAPLPGPLVQVELEWKARKMVEAKFHVFYMGASSETADALSAAVEAWKQTVKS